MNLSDRLEAFAKLGDYLKESLQDLGKVYPSAEETEEKFFKNPELAEIALEARMVNPWFIPAFTCHALEKYPFYLETPRLEEWTGKYSKSSFTSGAPKNVGTILAGNIPVVGFHDFLSVLITGHRFTGKVSGKDDKILPFLANKILEFESEFSDYIHFEEGHLAGIDAIIATGSNNSSRYFDYYFGKYPHIFRRNRNGVAILTGNESEDELTKLADDIFLYFGMGCRNVSKIYVPAGYEFNSFFENIENYHKVLDHHKYANNYQYQQSVFLMNRIEHLDNGFLLLRADPAIASAVGSLHYEFYTSSSELLSRLSAEKDEIQCIAGVERAGLSTLNFGSTQHPQLWDYADNVDTLDFLFNLYEN